MGKSTPVTPFTSTLVVDSTTVTSLLAVLFLLVSAYILSLRLLPQATSTKLRILFIWHLFDALIHFLFEGSFLYNCFFTFAPALPSTTNFLNRPDRTYGAAYGTSATAKLWQEYAKADHRWGEADVTVISLELLTVFGAGPIAVWICEMVRRGDLSARLWFWCVVLATGELYGGFMTFCPEWLSGSLNLDTSNFMYLWVYLLFFNMLWVWIPLWVLYEAYNKIQLAFSAAGGHRSVYAGLTRKEL